MKEIILSKKGKNKGRYVALVDDNNYDYLNQWNWYALKGSPNIYAARWVGSKLILMHRFIMNTPEGMQVDHIDHNGLNNQLNNLRNCTAKLNSQNVSKRSNNKTGYVGVCNPSDRRKYLASANDLSNNTVYLGSFDTAEEAARVRDDYVFRLYGVFANLNFDRE